MAHGITQPEAQPAEQHQAKEDGQQHERTQGQFRILPALDRRMLFLVEYSVHSTASGLKTDLKNARRKIELRWRRRRRG
jgi:hypothetical protein